MGFSPLASAGLFVIEGRQRALKCLGLQCKECPDRHKVYKWYIIVNHPCMEFWYHFRIIVWSFPKMGSTPKSSSFSMITWWTLSMVSWGSPIGRTPPNKPKKYMNPGYTSIHLGNLVDEPTTFLTYFSQAAVSMTVSAFFFRLIWRRFALLDGAMHLTPGD